MQKAIEPFTTTKIRVGKIVSLGMKVAVATGPVRRFLVGDPQIQYLDVLAGTTLDRMAAVSNYAETGEVLLGPEVIRQLGHKVVIAGWRQAPETGQPDQAGYAIVSGLLAPIEGATSWPPLPTLEEGGDQAAATWLTEAQARPWILRPVYERILSGQGEFLAEIRPAVILFLNFGGLDYDHDQAAGDKLDAYIRWVAEYLGPVRRLPPPTNDWR